MPPYYFRKLVVFVFIKELLQRVLDLLVVELVELACCALLVMALYLMSKFVDLVCSVLLAVVAEDLAE